MAHRQHEQPWGVWLVVCAVLLGTAGVGCSIGDRPASTWDELGQVASTYPLPEGFVLVATEQKGDLCRRPDCENPGVALRLAPTDSLTPDELCDALVPKSPRVGGLGIGPASGTHLHCPDNFMSTRQVSTTVRRSGSSSDGGITSEP